MGREGMRGRLSTPGCAAWGALGVYAIEPFESLGERGNVPSRSFVVSGSGVNCVEGPSAVDALVLGAVLLRPALVHEPAVVGLGHEAPGALVSQLDGGPGQFVCTPEVVEAVAVLEDHRGVEVVRACREGACLDKFSDPASSLGVPWAEGRPVDL